MDERLLIKVKKNVDFAIACKVLDKIFQPSLFSFWLQISDYPIKLFITVA